MATLQLTFSELYNAVSKFLGTYGSSGPSGTDLTDAKDAVHGGYRRFLNAYNWSFLRPYQTLTTVSGTWIYELPSDFSGIIGTFQFSDDDAYPPLEERSVDIVMDSRTVNDSTTYPEIYAIRPGKYSKETGQTWEVLFYPAPDAAYTLNYRYNIMPEKLSDDNDLHIGGPEVSECLKAFCLAKAELEKDEVSGVQEGEAIKLLSEAITQDNFKRPKTLGYNSDGGGMSAWEVARGSYRLNDVEYVLT
ncbi:MAG: phage adaptor protein [Planctomycetota bacterium]|jgi:hypothetical protein